MRNSRIEQAHKLRSRRGFLMADTTSGLEDEKQSWSLIPASMLAAPIPAAETLVRLDGLKPSIRVIMEHFYPASEGAFHQVVFLIAETSRAGSVAI
jgi:hypothetical protein